MSKENGMQFGTTGYKVADGWGRATREPAWRETDIPGVLQSRTQPSAQIKRNSLNVWESFSARQAAEQVARQVESTLPLEATVS